MNRRELLSRLGLVGAGVMAAGVPSVASQERATPAQRRASGFMLVTPDGPKDGGDFGRHTPGTRTAGIQEALDYAKKNIKDVYIAGGAIPKAFKGGAVYRIDQTIHVPWMQDFRLDSGENIIWYAGKTGDAIVFDSQMSCRYKFGLIATRSNGAVVRFQPKSTGPDDFSVITSSKFEFNGLVGHGDVFPTEGATRREGIGLALDCTHGPIDHNEIWVVEVVACDIGVDMISGVSGNFMRFPFVHLCNTHVRMDNHTWGNRIETSIHSQAIPGSEGLIVNGRMNTINVDVLDAAPGKSLIFAEDAQDNLIVSQGLASGITNNARRPTNKMITTYPVGFSIETPAFPASGQSVMNRGPYTVEAIVLAPGQVSEWTLTDALGGSQPVSGGLMAGQRFVLEPGDTVAFHYTSAPAWRWRAFSM